MTRCAELQVTSHFSFLPGASSCEDLSSQAALCGIETMAVCDRNSLAGIVRALRAGAWRRGVAVARGGLQR